MLTFTFKGFSKDRALDRVRRHRQLNQIVQGSETSWDEETESGDAVGCTAHSCYVTHYEWLLGIPRQLAKLENLIFDGMPLVDAVAWPEQFLLHIPESADVSHVALETAFAEIAHDDDGILRYAYNSAQQHAISRVLRLRAEGCTDALAWADAEKTVSALVGQWSNSVIPADAVDAATWANVWRREAGRHACYVATVAARAGIAHPSVAAQWMEQDRLIPWLQERGINPSDTAAVAKRLHTAGVDARDMAGVAITSMLRSCAFAAGHAGKVAAAEIAWRAGDRAVAEKAGDEAEASFYVRMSERLKQRLSAAPVVSAAA